jgi:glycosyltransferase involved in cell wall biosynthesis
MLPIKKFKEKLRILYITPYNFFIPQSGNQHLMYNLLNSISSEATCDVILLTNSFDESAKRAALKNFQCIENIFIFPLPGLFMEYLFRFDFFFRGYPNSFGKYKSPSLIKWIKRVESNYDLIHFDWMYTAMYNKYISKVPSIIVASDCYSLSATISLRRTDISPFRRIYIFLHYLALLNYEKKVLSKFSKVLVVSKKDKKALKLVSPKTNIDLLKVGYNSSLFKRKNNAKKNHIQDKRILILGNIDQITIRADVLFFLRYSIPVLLKSHPSLKITILGKSSSRDLVTFIGEFNSIITHIEYVDNFEEFLNDDWICVFPQKESTGVQTKVMHAMASELPVVGSLDVFNGLDVRFGLHAFNCKNINSMIKSVDILLSNKSLRKSVGLSASKFIKANYSREVIRSEITSIYKNVLKDFSIKREKIEFNG